MKSLVALVLVLLCLTSEASAQVARVTAERTNLRDRPATNATIVAGLSRGDELEVLERAGTWYRVRVRSTGQEGYVSSLLVETIGPGTAPAAAPPPGPPAASPAPVAAPEPTPAETFATAAPPSSGRRSLEFGARLGLNRSTIDTTDDDDDSVLAARTALTGGGLVRLWLSDRFALQFETIYSPQGAKFDFDEDVADVLRDAVFKLDYLQIPALGVLSFGSGSVRPFVLAGPVAGFRLAAKVEAGEISEDVEEFVSTTDLGVMVGGGVDVGRLTIDVRYLLGVKNIEVDPETDAVTKNRALMLGVSFRF